MAHTANDTEIVKARQDTFQNAVRERLREAVLPP